MVVDFKRSWASLLDGVRDSAFVPHHSRWSLRTPGGNHFNPYTYDDIKTIADHFHYLGARPHGGNGRSDAAGGGHAHAGAMIYLGGTWPPNIATSCS